MSCIESQPTATPRPTQSGDGRRAHRQHRLRIAGLCVGGGLSLILGCRPATDSKSAPAASLTVAAAPSSNPVQTQPTPQLNLLVVTLDTTRADHLGCYGYFRDTSPHLDAFAAEALVFDSAFAPMATTLPTHVSLFTALHPLEHGVLANVTHGGSAFGLKPAVVSVAQLARERGYATAAFVSATPVKRSAGLAVGFDVYDEPSAASRRAQATTDAALDWLSAGHRRPYFLWVHYFDPHAAYRPPAPYDAHFATDQALETWIHDRRLAPRVGRDALRGGNPTETRAIINLYDGEIRYMDEQFGRLLRWLRENNLWESTAIVVLADHGEGLNQHEWLQHGGTWEEQLHAALMMRVPGPGGTTPGRVATLMTTADVLPTLLPLMNADWGGPLLKQASGVNVLAPGFRERPLLSLRTGREDNPNPGPDTVLRSAEWTLHLNDPAAGTLLFDRRRDPFELENRAAAEADVVTRLTDQLHALVRHFHDRGMELDAGGKAEDAAPLDEKTLRELRALGYIGGDDGNGEAEDERP